MAQLEFPASLIVVAFGSAKISQLVWNQILLPLIPNLVRSSTKCPVEVSNNARSSLDVDRCKSKIISIARHSFRKESSRFKITWSSATLPYRDKFGPNIMGAGIDDGTSIDDDIWQQFKKFYTTGLLDRDLPYLAVIIQILLSIDRFFVHSGTCSSSTFNGILARLILHSMPKKKCRRNIKSMIQSIYCPEDS
ncbi:hypothetical protein OPQ81_000561 [Rhizoctonia solani]|nr:hypothetical protein OPQ81_000561 [Rhizoctonia solani]